MFVGRALDGVSTLRYTFIDEIMRSDDLAATKKGQTMLKLAGCSIDDNGSAVATYLPEVAGETGSVAQGVKVDLVTNADGAMARVIMDHQRAGTEEEALDALAIQLMVIAKAIKARGEPKFCVPAYGA